MKIKMSAKLKQVLNKKWEAEKRSAQRYGWEPDFKICIDAVAFGGYIRRKKGGE